MVPKSIRKIVEKGTISIYTFVLHIEWQNLVYKRKGILIFFLVKNARDSYLTEQHYLRSSRFIDGDSVPQSLVFCVVFCEYLLTI
jgi:hypothetical protein